MNKLRKIYEFGREYAAHIKKQNVSAFAASTAFFFFLSMVPMLIMLCSIIPFTPLTEANLLEAVTELVPKQIAPLVVSLVDNVYEKSAGVLSVAILTTVWSAGKGLMALMQGLNAIWDVEEHRNYFVIRLIASFYTIVMLAVVMVSLVLMVFGDKLSNLILYRLPQLQAVASFAMNFRFLVVWALLSLLFTIVYTYVPDKKLKCREQIPGAVFAAVMWSVFSWCFSAYLDYGNPYGIYGSLSIIIIVLLWMYFCMYLFLAGVNLNKFFAGKA